MSADDIPLSFSHVGFHVSDLSRVSAFYEQVLGFTVTDRGNLGSASLVFLSREPSEHHQLALVSGRPPEGFGQINQISFRVPDIGCLRRMHQRAQAFDVQDLVAVTHGNAISIYFRDPEGNRIEVFMDTPWYCEQPLREPVDLSQGDEELLAQAQRIASGRPKFQPRAKWQAEMAKRMGLVQE